MKKIFLTFIVIILLNSQFQIKSIEENKQLNNEKKIEIQNNLVNNQIDKKKDGVLSENKESENDSSEDDFKLSEVINDVKKIEDPLYFKIFDKIIDCYLHSPLLFVSAALTSIITPIFLTKYCIGLKHKHVLALEEQKRVAENGGKQKKIQ